MSLTVLPADMKSKIFQLLRFDRFDSLQNELCQYSFTICRRDWRACLDSLLPLQMVRVTRVGNNTDPEFFENWVSVQVDSRYFDLIPFNGGPIWENLADCYGFEVHESHMRIRHSANAALAIRNLSMLLMAQLQNEYPLYTFSLQPGDEMFSISLTAVPCHEKMIPELDSWEEVAD